MARLVKSITVTAALLMTGPGLAAERSAAENCDLMAGSLLDHDLPDGIQGVSFDALDTGDVVKEACLAAIDEHPAKRRFLTHLGHVYAKRGNFREALASYRQAHARGSALAAYQLGMMYQRGQGVSVDDTRATRYIRKAANRGLSKAMVEIAARARDGLGMPANARLSVFWYDKAYVAGDVMAANELGKMYRDGIGVRQDGGRAMELFSEAVRRAPDNASSLYNMGRAYEAGYGAGPDLGWARAYYVLAFEAGHADAAMDIARLHADGTGTVADNGAALTWYTRGSEKGSLQAMIALGDAYAEGTGTEAAPDMARSVFLRALDLRPDDETAGYIKDRLAALDLSDALGTSEQTE